MVLKVDRHEGNDTGGWAWAVERGGEERDLLKPIGDSVGFVEVFQT